MATAAHCGTSGSVSLGGEITRWTVNLEMEAIDATSMASAGNKEFVGCLKSASGDFDTLIPCGGVGAETGVSFVNAQETITMDLIITDIVTDVDVNGIVTFKYSFVSSGAIT